MALTVGLLTLKRYKMVDAEALARAFHDNYERLAPDHGYATREASAKPWADVPANNKALMIATAQALLDAGWRHV